MPREVYNKSFPNRVRKDAAMKTLVNVFHPKLAQSTVNRLWRSGCKGYPM